MPSQSVSLPRPLSWQQAITCLSLTPERIIPEMKVIILPQLGIQPTQLQQTRSQSKAPTHKQTVASGEQITLRLLISTRTRAITRHPMHPFLKRSVIFALSLWRWHLGVNGRRGFVLWAVLEYNYVVVSWSFCIADLSQFSCCAEIYNKVTRDAEYINTTAALIDQFQSISCIFVHLIITLRLRLPLTLLGFKTQKHIILSLTNINTKIFFSYGT